MNPALVVLAAGLGTRFGGAKQLEPLGPGGAALMDYAIYDALRAGFTRVVLVVRPELEEPSRARVRARFGPALDLQVVPQRLAGPRGGPAPAGRSAPWGTGHAVLVTEHAVAGPFAVCNADDFYGASSYRLLGDHLRSAAASQEFALVGFRLGATLATTGGVSRGLCEVAPDGSLRAVREVRDIADRPDGLYGVTRDGARWSATAGDVVSMNLWGFTPAVFPLLRDRFARFLASEEPMRGREFLLNETINALIAEGAVRVRVLPTDAEAFGVTHPDDRMPVAARLATLHGAGHYPDEIGPITNRQREID